MVPTEALPRNGSRKIGSASHHHTADHHVAAKTYLRGGTVKARMPRECAGGAKRRALHAAEHRSSIDCVMASAPNVATIVNTSRTSKAGTVARRIRLHHRVRNECSSGTRTSRPSGTRLSGRSGFRSARTCGPHSRRFRDRPQTLRRPTQDTDSHGVSDPSGHAQGHFQRAHRGRSRHVSCSDRGAGACSVGGKDRRLSCRCRAPTVELAARESVIGGAGGGRSLA